MAPDRSAFPVGSVGPCLEATAGIPFTIRPVTSLLLPWRTFALYIPLQDIIWLLRRLRLPQRPLAFSRLQSGLVLRCRDDLVDFPSSEARDIGPLAACSTPGGLGDNAVWEGDPSRPPPYLLVQVSKPLPPVSSHDAHADFFRQHGSRAGR